MKVFVVSLLVCVLGLASGQDYSSALSKSILFFEGQRTGKLPANNRIAWRGDSFLEDKDAGLDLTGGYFDAGDHVKFGLPLGHSMIFLAWSLIDYQKGYTAAGELDNGLAGLKWGADWIVKASANRANGVVYGQCGDGNTDHSYWGRPEEQTQTRPCWAVTAALPGTELVSNYASALALTSLAFGNKDATYSAECLKVARELFTLATGKRGKYTDAITNAGGFYASYSYNDELAFAAAVMALVTGEQQYKTAAANYWTEFGMDNIVQEFFDWDNKNAGIAVILARVLGDQKYKTSAQAHADKWLNYQKTPKGLVYINAWGSLRHAANAAFGCLLVADSGIGNTANYRAFAKAQIDYILSSTGRSFVAGYGTNPPAQPHHRAASCPNKPATCDWNNYNSNAANPQVHNGALVGGPDASDNYVDSRQDFQKNEVAIDYNAGFQAALAGLLTAGF